MADVQLFTAGQLFQKQAGGSGRSLGGHPLRSDLCFSLGLAAQQAIEVTA